MNLSLYPEDINKVQVGYIVQCEPWSNYDWRVVEIFEYKGRLRASLEVVVNADKNNLFRVAPKWRKKDMEQGVIKSSAWCDDLHVIAINQ